jgi:hypothetical protein
MARSFTIRLFEMDLLFCTRVILGAGLKCALNRVLDGLGTTGLKGNF